MQVLAADESEDHGHTGSRLIWITDVVPDELAWPIADLMDQGAEAMQRTLGGRGREEDQPVGPKRSTRIRSAGTPTSTRRSAGGVGEPGRAAHVGGRVGHEQRRQVVDVRRPARTRGQSGGASRV